MFLLPAILFIFWYSTSSGGYIPKDILCNVDIPLPLGRGLVNDEIINSATEINLAHSPRLDGLREFFIQKKNPHDGFVNRLGFP